MFEEDQLEKKIYRNKKKLKELEIKKHSLDSQIESLFAELNLSIKELQKFSMNRQNFSDVAWDVMNKKREELEHGLEKKLSLVFDKEKMKSKMASRNVQPHWLFVR